jgi:hypothetical protein
MILPGTEANMSFSQLCEYEDETRNMAQITTTLWERRPRRESRLEAAPTAKHCNLPWYINR